MADQADNIFNTGSTQNQNQGTTGTVPNTQTNPLATLLNEIKNERGEPKYKSVEDALNALKHSQEYIPTLKQTKDELEARLQEVSAKAAKVEALELIVQELTQKVGQPQQTTQAGITPEQVAELVTQTLTKTQLQAKEQENVTTVVTTLKNAYGDKAEEVFGKKAEELGLTIAEFNAMAKRTPQAVLQLVGVTPQKTTAVGAITSTVNTAGFQPKQDSMIGRNKQSALLGATTHQLREEQANAAKMVEELNAQGLSVSDLTDPKVYFKLFK